MVRTMNIWTDNTPEAQKARKIRYRQAAIKWAEGRGEIYPKSEYEKVGLTPHKKATDKYQPAPLWRRIINSLRPVW